MQYGFATPPTMPAANGNDVYLDRYGAAFELEDLHSADQLSAEASSTVVFGLAPAAYGVFLLAMVALWWRNRSLAAAARSAGPGRAVVRGVVENGGDREPVLRIDISQNGTEWQNKGSWSHQWKETGRKLWARPFGLRTPDGALLQVDPGEGPLFVTPLEQTVKHHHNQRTRMATVSAGDTVEIVAAPPPVFPVGAGYRGSAQAGVLRPPAGGRMTIAKEPLEKRFYERAALHKKWALATVLLLLFTNVVCFMGFHQRLARGEQLDGTVVSQRTYITRSKNSTTTHYEVTASVLVDGAQRTVREDVRRPVWQRLARGSRVPLYVVGDGSWFTTVGLEPTLHVAGVIVGVLVFLIVGIGYPIHALTSRPWYAKRRFAEGGAGRLL